MATQASVTKLGRLKDKNNENNMMRNMSVTLVSESKQTRKVYKCDGRYTDPTMHGCI